MKLFLGSFMVLILWMGSTTHTTDSGITDVVLQSLQTGSAQQLAAHFDTNIELIIDSEAIEFPSVEATHAEFILRSFFRKYPPRRFQYVYQGMADHQQYSTGTYQTGRERFQVYVLMREAAGRNGRYSTATASASQPGIPGTGRPRYLISTLHFRKVS